MRGSKLVSAVALVALAGAVMVPSIAEAQSAKEKFNRGFSNLALGFIEIPGTIKEEAAASNPVQGLVVGLIKGSFRFVRREVVGAYELVTFPVEVPEGYDKIVEPEYPWQYFE
jgi:putative exosortase-associated protein (TIGR04073 family)